MKCRRRSDASERRSVHSLHHLYCKTDICRNTVRSTKDIPNTENGPAKQ